MASVLNGWCVYQLRDETGKVRYVGKGRPARAQQSAKRRNLAYEIVAANLPENEAFSLESDLILRHGLDALDNVKGPWVPRPNPALDATPHAALLRAFIERHDLSKVRAAELLGLSDPPKAGRVAVTRWLNGAKCQIPLETLRAALAEMDRRLKADAH